MSEVCKTCYGDGGTYCTGDGGNCWTPVLMDVQGNGFQLTKPRTELILMTAKARFCALHGRSQMEMTRG